MYYSEITRATSRVAKHKVYARVNLFVAMAVALCAATIGASFAAAQSPTVAPSGSRVFANGARVPELAPLPEIAPNVNRQSIGRLTNGRLSVEIDARMGAWFPEGRESVGLQVAAFAEVGKSLQNPGPIIRVTQGTHVSVRMRNSLVKPLTIRGLGKVRGVAADSVRIEPGAEYHFEFEATTPGTFYYAGVTGRSPVYSRGEEHSQLNGAINHSPAIAPCRITMSACKPGIAPVDAACMTPANCVALKPRFPAVTRFQAVSGQYRAVSGSSEVGTAPSGAHCVFTPASATDTSNAARRVTRWRSIM